MTDEEFSMAYTRGYQRTVGFLRSRGVPEKEAFDFAQDGWFRGWRKLSLLKEPKMLFTWINRISLNLYLKHLSRRSDALHHAFEVLNHQAMIVEDNGTDIERKIDLARILQKCSKYHRYLIVMQLYGWTPREMSRINNVDVSTLKIRQWRARNTARKVRIKIESGELK